MKARKRLRQRSSVDLKDIGQVRAIKKRSRVTEDELPRIVARLGASIAAIGNEVAVQWACRLTQPVEAPPAAVIAATESVAETITAAEVAAG